MTKHLLLATCVAFLALGSTENSVETENPSDCVTEFLQWCANNDYPANGEGVSILSTSYFDNGQMVRVTCRSDWEGTVCRRNQTVWYHCYPNHTLEYEGQTLSENSASDAGICDAKDQAIQTQFNSTAFKKEFGESMDRFHERMDELRKRMDDMRKRFSSPNFPFGSW